MFRLLESSEGRQKQKAAQTPPKDTPESVTKPLNPQELSGYRRPVPAGDGPNDDSCQPASASGALYELFRGVRIVQRALSLRPRLLLRSLFRSLFRSLVGHA